MKLGHLLIITTVLGASLTLQARNIVRESKARSMEQKIERQSRQIDELKRLISYVQGQMDGIQVRLTDVEGYLSSRS